jgi:hypothetical protein
MKGVRHFFHYSPFSPKTVPISQFLTKSNNPNTNFRAFFMLYTNRITKINKNLLWSYQTISEVVHGGVLGPIVKYFYFSPLPTNFFLISIF